MGKPCQKLNMYEPTVFRICIQGDLDVSWFEYFGAQSVSVEEDQAGNAITSLTSEPMDQAALIGLVNHLNGLGIPLISVECKLAKRNTAAEAPKSREQRMRQHEQTTR